jgi:3-methyladenine DNA glycosylase/8-oxoguanine DNA glycosylase
VPPISADLLVQERRWRPSYPLDLRRTLGHLGRGKGDPTHRHEADGSVWRTAPTPDGPGTLMLRRSADGWVAAQAWGTGADWLLDRLPDLLGAADETEGFPAHAHPVIADAWRRCGEGLRFPATRLIFDQVSVAVLEQKVTGIEARRSWRELVWRFGTAAPGPAPAGMAVAPYPDAWLAIPDWEWHRAGVDLNRRRAIRAAATVAARLDEVAGGPVEAAVRRLRSLPGIGVWTAAEVAQRAMSGADAVSVGDYHLPSVVGWALVGKKLDDAGMLDVLIPFAPHRARAVRLTEFSGAKPPRRGPRFAPRDYRSF